MRPDELSATITDLARVHGLNPAQQADLINRFATVAGGGIAAMRESQRAALADSRGPLHFQPDPDHPVALALHVLLTGALAEHDSGQSIAQAAPTMTAEDLAAAGRVRDTADRLRASGQPDLADNLLASLKG